MSEKKLDENENYLLRVDHKFRFLQKVLRQYLIRNKRAFKFVDKRRCFAY